MSTRITAEAPIDQHNIEIEKNRRSWERKPLLRQIYRRFYKDISEAIKTTDGRDVLELGSGIGAIKTTLPLCLTSDIFPNPWLDRTESAYEIKLSDASLSGLILFDVWHHLEFPRVALQEFSRVVRPKGRVVIFDPAIGALGRLIYGGFHHEPVAMNEAITWTLPSKATIPLRYYAAQGNCWRTFFKKQVDPKYLSNFIIREVRTYSALSYVASGGFSKPQLFPQGALKMIEKIEALADRWPNIFATRMLVCLERV